MTTPVEFLLARIAEHEAAARDTYRCNTDQRCTPARVLAECDAKRRIVELHHTIDIYKWNPDGYCAECSDSGWNTGLDGAFLVDAPCPTLRLLAVPYADHSDYRKEWRP